MQSVCHSAKSYIRNKQNSTAENMYVNLTKCENVPNAVQETKSNHD